MTGTASALHLLDDYLESIENVPNEIQQQLQLLAEKDVQLEELQRNLFKKRSVLLKAQEKSLDETMQASLRRRADKDAHRAAALIEEKIQMQQSMLQILDVHMQRLEKEVYKPLGLPCEPVYAENGPFGDLADPEPLVLSASSRGVSLATATVQQPLLSRMSPKKRASLLDEPAIDPDEPVYCYCRQASYGEMIACDGTECALEWFHYGCVGLTAPPASGKWYCKACTKE